MGHVLTNSRGKCERLQNNGTARTPGMHIVDFELAGLVKVKMKQAYRWILKIQTAQRKSAMVAFLSTVSSYDSKICARWRLTPYPGSPGANQKVLVSSKIGINESCGNWPIHL